MDVPDRRPVQQRLLGKGHRPLEPERLDQALAKRPVPRDAREVLDDPAGEHIAGVAVRERGAERMVLHDVLHARDVALDALVAAAGVGEHVAVDPARVREEMTRRDLSS